ncbi:MAG: glycoside hydrolase family 95 protein [Treponema sp.]|nr:glycoside hydrolase family 95 protein [Treponema sp.]
MRSRLLFNKPPATWEHYLPLGNGRLGAMLAAQPCNEVIQLNEEGIWSGGPQDRTNENAHERLEEIRLLINQGKVFEAQEMAFRHLSGRGFNERVYQTAGELHIDFFCPDNEGIEFSFPPQHITPKECLDSYSSCLNLDDAYACVKYRDRDGTGYERTVFASAADDMIFMRVKSSEKEKISFRAYLDRGIHSDCLWAEGGCVFLEDAHGIPFCVGAGAVSDGQIKAEGFTLCGQNCSDIIFFIDVRAWQYSGKITADEFKESILCGGWKALLKERLSNMNSFIKKEGVQKAFDILFERHKEEYRSYWDRMELCIGDDGSGTDCGAAGQDEPSVKELFDSFREKGDVRLVNLYAAFSRYLMIAGSRKPGKLPLTLQGLWNCYVEPPWGSKYTVNINTQMNYWPSCMAALDECEIPLFNLLERVYEQGKDVARRMYRCRGYVLHHNTDFWGDAAPQDAWLAGSYWVLGAAWLACHIWTHYEYGQDVSFLERYYYLIHEACLFFVDFLVPSERAGLAEDGKPFLVVSPSVSPENSYRLADYGRTATICEGCQMDNMILTHLFTCQRKASDRIKALGRKCLCRDGVEYPERDADDFAYVLSHLKAPELNSDGSLMEWNSEYEEVEKGHRHISHLYGLFPGESISPDGTPALAQAAEKTLLKRLSFGGGHTGWSQAWVINFWASLYKGDLAADAVRKILLDSTLPNLLDNHPPFQIDGNFGALAGILRMLVQSSMDDDGKPHVRILPALPHAPEWQSGFVRGIRVKGGLSLSFSWKDGRSYNVKMEKI